MVENVFFFGLWAKHSAGLSKLHYMCTEEDFERMVFLQKLAYDAARNGKPPEKRTKWGKNIPFVIYYDKYQQKQNNYSKTQQQQQQKQQENNILKTKILIKITFKFDIRNIIHHKINKINDDRSN